MLRWWLPREFSNCLPGGVSLLNKPKSSPGFAGVAAKVSLLRGSTVIVAHKGSNYDEGVAPVDDAMRTYRGMRMRATLGVRSFAVLCCRRISFEIVVAWYRVDLWPIHSRAGPMLSAVR